MIQTTRDATIATMKLATAGLAAGTAIEGYVQGSRIFGQTVAGMIATILFAAFMVVIFDRTGTKNLFALGQHFTGQERLGKGVLIVALIGVLGFAGSMTFSLLSVPVISDVANGETQADDRIEAATTRAQGVYNKALAAADAQIAAARRTLSDAMAAEKTARKRAIDAQGGEFARLASQGNTWVWVDDGFRKQRKNVAALEARAKEDVREARGALSMAENTKARLIEKGAIDEGTQALIATQATRFQTWMDNRQNTRSVTLVLTVGCGVLVLLMLGRQIAAGKVEECRTISDVVGDALEDIHDAVLDLGDGAGRAMAWAKMKTHGIVAPNVGGERLREVVPPVQGFSPPAEGGKFEGVKNETGAKEMAESFAPWRKDVSAYKGSERDKLRRKIARYKRLAAADKLGEKGRKTLAAMEKRYAKLRGEK